MNAAKLTRLEGGLTTVARKVLDAVPIQEPWEKQTIVMELRRTGVATSVDIIEGCLRSLKDRGLVKEPRSGFFVRPKFRPAAAANDDDLDDAGAPTPPPTTTTKAPPVRTTLTVSPPATTEPANTLTRLADLASSLRKTADEVDAIAIDVEERIAVIEKDGEKLRQLQALLKSIGT